MPDKKLPDSYKQQILRRIGKEEGFVDYITLSGSLLFSGKYATNFDDLKKHPFYCKHKQKDYVVDGYLEGVQVVSCDYRSLYEQYKDNEKVVFLLDPPYLSTDSSSYKSDTYWKLRDYLDVITLLNSQRYVYFTSNKSQIIELCEWIASATNGYWANPFAGAETRTVSGSVNYNSTYTDIMVYNTYSDE